MRTPRVALVCSRVTLVTMDNPPVSSNGEVSDPNRSACDQPPHDLARPEVRPNNGVWVTSEHRDLSESDGVRSALVHLPPTTSDESELDTDGLPEIYKRVEAHSLVSSAAVQLTPVLLPYL